MAELAQKLEWIFEKYDPPDPPLYIVNFNATGSPPLLANDEAFN